MHAAWQALQPMHFETSISFATCCSWRTCGDGAVEAELRTMSRDCKSAIARSPSHHRRSRSFLDVHQERLELRGFRVGIANARGERVGAVAFARQTGKTPVDR